MKTEYRLKSAPEIVVLLFYTDLSTTSLDGVQSEGWLVTAEWIDGLGTHFARPIASGSTREDAMDNAQVWMDYFVIPPDHSDDPDNRPSIVKNISNRLRCEATWPAIRLAASAAKIDASSLKFYQAVVQQMGFSNMDSVITFLDMTLATELDL